MHIKNGYSITCLWIASILPLCVCAQSPALDIQSEISSALKLFYNERLSEDEMRQLAELPIESVPILTEQLSRIPLESSDRPVFDLLALKVGIFESRLTEPELSKAVDALLARVVSGPKWELDRKATSLSRINNAKIREAVARIRGKAPSVNIPPADNSVLYSVQPANTPAAKTGPAIAKPQTASKVELETARLPMWTWTLAGCALLLIAVLSWKFSRK